MVVPPTLVGVIAFAFEIPALRDIRVYSFSGRWPLLLYLFWLIPSLVFSILLLGEIVPVSAMTQLEERLLISPSLPRAT